MPDAPPETLASAKEIKRYLSREQLRRAHPPHTTDSVDATHVKLYQIDYLLSAARNGNFGAAAAEFGVSGSALGHAVAELEKSLGIRLFERDQRGARLTSQGEALIEHAERLLAAEDAMRIAAAKLGGRTAPHTPNAGEENDEHPIVMNVEAVRNFRSDVADGALAAIEAIEREAVRQSRTAAFPLALFEELKHALPKVGVSGESVDRVADVLDRMQASVSGEPQIGDRAHDETAGEVFRQRHSSAATRFTQGSVRFDTRERPSGLRPGRPRAR